MAVEFVLRFPEGTTQQYDDVMRIVGLDQPGAAWPDGLLSHTAGAYDGGLCVVDVWEADEDFDRFLTSTLQPAMATVGVPQPEVTRVEVYNRWAGNARNEAAIHAIFDLINRGDYDRIPDLISPDYVDHSPV